MNGLYFNAQQQALADKKNIKKLIIYNTVPGKWDKSSPTSSRFDPVDIKTRQDKIWPQYGYISSFFYAS